MAKTLPPEEAEAIARIQALIALITAAAPANLSQIQCKVKPSGSGADLQIPFQQTPEMVKAANEVVSHMAADSGILFNGIEIDLTKDADGAWQSHIQVIA